MENKDLLIELISISGGTQQRDIDDAIVEKYAALMKDGVVFPPLSVIFDGRNFILWDGFHRYHAHRKLNKKSIECVVENGTLREAIYKSFCANKIHGFPRNEAALKGIVLKILKDDDWSKKSDHDIAKDTGINRSYISHLRREYIAEQVKKASLASGVGGTTRPQNSSENAEKTKNGDESTNATSDGQAATATTSKPTEPKPMLDSTKRLVPEKLRVIFERATELRRLANQVMGIAKKIKEAQLKNDPLYYYIRSQSIETDANNLKRAIKGGLPYAVCPSCGGDGGHCKNCTQTSDKGECKGWLNELRWRTTASDLKK